MYMWGMIEKELVAASTEPLILSLLSKGESYGYELIQEVKGLSEDKIKWTDGMLYPVLHRMEDNGWIKSRWVEIENGRKRKYYSIKRDGRQALKAKREQWAVVSSVLRGLACIFYTPVAASRQSAALFSSDKCGALTRRRYRVLTVPWMNWKAGNWPCYRRAALGLGAFIFNFS